MQSWNLETLLVQITGQILDEGGREEGGSRLEVHLYLSHNMSHGYKRTIIAVVSIDSLMLF